MVASYRGLLTHHANTMPSPAGADMADLELNRRARAQWTARLRYWTAERQRLVH